MHYILFYDYVPDYLERRDEFRKEHVTLANAARDRGELFLAGAFADPADGAALIFQGDSAEVAKSFAKSDPYVLNGLVTNWRVREWMTIVGKDAEHPISF